MKLYIPFFCILLFSCSDSTSVEERLAVELESGVGIQRGSIQAIPVKNKKEYALEELTLEKEMLKEVDRKVHLQFKEELPTGYEIHYTVNNGPLMISKTTDIEVEVLEGNNVVLAFLSLANGLRIPNPKAVYLKNYSIGLDESNEVTNTGVHLFHNLSNTADSAAFYLDFYAENVPEGSNYLARVIADGNTFNVPLDKAYKLNGMTKEYHNLRIQLIDATGKVASGPFNDTGVISVKVE